MANRLFSLLSLVVALMCAAPNAFAGALDDAIAAWLADDDYRALPALSKLAKSGDTDAQLFLGVISGRPYSPYVANLSRSERNELLRAPGGVSGLPWLGIAAGAGDRRAAALVAVQIPPFEAAPIAALIAMGEDDAAATALARSTAYGGVSDLAELPAATAPADLDYAVSRALSMAGDEPPAVTYIKDQPSSYAAALLHAFAHAALWSRAPKDSPQRDQMLRLFPGDYRGTDAASAGALLSHLVEISRPANRLFTYCAAACPKDVKRCAGDAVALLGGYDQVWRFGPPLTSLISEERYLNSKRFHADIARHLRNLMEFWTPSRKAYWTETSCAAASRFRARFP